MESASDILYVSAISSIFLLIIVGFFIAFIAIYQKRQKQNELEQVKIKEAFNQELYETQLELKEQVLKQIAQEIHDNIGQSLTVAKMQLSFVKEESVQDKVGSVKELISRSLDDLRDLSKSLSGNFIMREGLEASIHREAAHIDKLDNLSCNVVGSYPNGFLNENSEMILFRCVQECLSNAVKYSQGSEVEISLNGKEDTFELVVKDNGVGFPENWEENQGVGIDSLHKRVGVLNGVLNILTKPNEGSKISIVLNR